MSVIAIACLGTVACRGGSGAPGGSDAGDAAVDQMNVDAGPEIIVQVPTCQNAHSVCDGPTVLACVDGQRGDRLEICRDTCSLGRCTTTACKQIEDEEGTRGCRFYGAQADNVDSEDDRTLMVLLSNAGPTSAAALVEVRDAGGVWRPLMSGEVPGGGSIRIQINKPVREAGVTLAGGYRVETDSPVFAVQIMSDDSDRMARSSGGTVLLPLQALGGNYLAVTAPEQGSPEVLGTPGSRDGAGAIAIVATENNTFVRVGLAAEATMILPGAVADPLPGSSGVVLHDGDVLQIFSDAPGADLTGTTIVADAPVAVFSGNTFTTYGNPVSGFNGGDLTLEQLPPTVSWGLEYIGARLSPQEGCDPFFGAGAGLWRVVAAADDTKVTLLPAPGTSIEAPDLSSDLTFRLGRGAFQSFVARGSRNPPITSGDFLVQADKPILLAQWLDCEPGLALGIDTRLLSGNLDFTLPPAFDHEVVLVRKGAKPVTFDGRPVTDDLWKPISSVGTFGVVRLGAGDLGRCADALDRCEHHVSGAAFGVSWRGMDIVCSYALTVPSVPVCALPNVTCIP